MRGLWSVENRNHHKRDESVWQENRHRFRRVNVAQNLALTRNALLLRLARRQVPCHLKKLQ